MFKSIPRSVLYTVAILWWVAATTYSIMWMVDNRSMGHPVELGFNIYRDTSYQSDTHSIPVYNVAPGSPAERAGLLPDDQIIAINGQTLDSYALFDHIWSTSSPGDHVRLTVRRPSQPGTVDLEGVFQVTKLSLPTEGFGRSAARQIINFFPVLFLIVGGVVLFSRIDDPYAWLLALLFTCMIATAPCHLFGRFPPFMQRGSLAFRGIFDGMAAPMVYVFFAVFPERSVIDKRAPWLKWLAIAFGISQAIPGLAAGDPQWPQFLQKKLGPALSYNSQHLIVYSFVALGFLSLFLSAIRRNGTVDGRRKARVLLWGSVLGTLPFILQRAADDLFHITTPFWVTTVVLLLICVYPLSFAYAIVRYRVLEIPALLRRSARYVLVQRGYVTLLVCAAVLVVFLFARFLSIFFAQHSEFALASSAIFGVGLVWASGPLVKRGTQRIDRAFFRSSYDARLILQDLAAKTRDVTNREELATLLRQHLQDALHPRSLAFYFIDATGELKSADGDHAVQPPIPPGSPFLEFLRERGRAWDVPPPTSSEYPANFPIASLSPECVVPLLGRNARLVGLIVLGQSLSEEPYSREDKRMLESVAGQCAVALENIGLAENIADRLAAEQRAAHEIQIARDVQSRLFPQTMPPLRTLEYAGACIQARQVGGDYYDFLDLGDSRVAFVLADISGKGIAGALLMANLQANLRSRAAALNDLAGLMKSVNKLFFENSPEDRYATMFICVYDDSSRSLEYANCGHNPPLLFRKNGAIEHLTTTGTVVGLFADWECETREIVLQPGDLLVIYTDGVTEANDADLREFGEARLVSTVRACQSAPPQDILAAIERAVQIFDNDNPSDDLTLVVARAR